MVEKPDERLRRVRAGIAGLKRMRSFVGYRESFDLAKKLEALLEDARATVDDPRDGVDLVAAFFETDKHVFESCDDSSGSVGDVYRGSALELFLSYAVSCEDKRHLADLVWRLAVDDEYSVRSGLVDRAISYLPEDLLRELSFRAWAEAKKEEGEPRAHRLYRMIESFSRQLRDPAAFERARRASWPKLGPAACYDIAEVYLESGDMTSALSWIRKVPAAETFEDYRRDELLLLAYEATGNLEERDETARRVFRRFRSGETLDDLLVFLGEGRREVVVEEEARLIDAEEEFSSADAMFLVECGRVEEAELYILARADQLDGRHYESLLPLAQMMEKNGHLLAGSILYRALLESILARAISKYYTHGVRYLRKLDALAPRVTAWGAFASHDAYAASLRKDHARKSAFWGRYRGS